MYCVTICIEIIVIYFFYPETQGRTLEELAFRECFCFWFCELYISICECNWAALIGDFEDSIWRQRISRESYRGCGENDTFWSPWWGKDCVKLRLIPLHSIAWERVNIAFVHTARFFSKGIFGTSHFFFCFFNEPLFFRGFSGPFRCFFFSTIYIFGMDRHPTTTNCPSKSKSKLHILK